MKIFFMLLISAAALSASAFLFTEPPAVPGSSIILTAPPLSSFQIAIMNGGIDDGYARIKGELHSNLWAKYTDSPNNFGWVTSYNTNSGVDLLDASTGFQSYANDVIAGNSSAGMNTLMHRVKIEYLCYGQRSDYECESESFYRLDNPEPDYWFYTYSTHDSAVSADYIDNSAYGSGRKVRYSRTPASTNSGSWINSAGYVCEGLKTNREQCASYHYSSVYSVDYKYAWHLKPRIRIDPVVANSSPNTPVCKIEVLNFNGNKIKEADIYARNFRVNNLTNYDGSYLELFHFASWDDTSNLVISYGTNFNPGRGGWEVNNPLDSNYSKVDIKVYWYGICDMWVDRVRVDNEVANDLFNGVYDNTWLKWEIEDIAMKNRDNVKYFYLEEFEFNNRPCMKYVNEKIQALSSGNMSLLCNPYWGGYNIHKQNVNLNPFSPVEFKRTLIDYVGLKALLMGSYAFKGYHNVPGTIFKDEVYVPASLPVSDYNPSAGRFSLPKDPAGYDEWLQGYFNDSAYNFWQRGEFRMYNELCNYIAKECNIPFYTMVQTHLFYVPPGSPVYREPTNEEISLLVNLPITYGSKGMFYYEFPGYNTMNINNFFSRGLADPVFQDLQLSTLLSSRHQNVYNQYDSASGNGSKYNTVAALNYKLANFWGPVIQNFDNDYTNSYIYHLRYNDCLNETYFNDIKTYPPSSLLSLTPSAIPDSAAVTYLQAAVFKIPGEPETNYFMLVNRRCSPYDADVPTDGGRRDIKAKFDKSLAKGKWKITDIETRKEIIFHGDASPYVDLGWFMPAEGKLYKIVSVN
jgi:hypothetical protein